MTPPERVLTCVTCRTPTVVADIDLTNAGGPYLDPTTYTCGQCLEDSQKTGYGEFPKGY